MRDEECVLQLNVQNVKLLEISSIHDGHDQTEFFLCLKGVRQRHNEATVNLLKDTLLHHRPLQEEKKKRKDNFEN